MGRRKGAPLDEAQPPETRGTLMGRRKGAPLDEAQPPEPGGR
jgi:hypothetical protein